MSALSNLADKIAQAMANEDCGCGTVDGVLVTDCRDVLRYAALAEAVLAVPAIAEDRAIADEVREMALGRPGVYKWHCADAILEAAKARAK